MILEEAFDWNVAWAPVWLRALIHTGIIGMTFAIAKLTRTTWL